ncbi:MAG: hypothetical protein J2P54_00395 [Bradyrhizobiaceae bacterium]|nr:hypothetical protein [Bradyrhizobiaceae bacterium]
MDNWRRLGAAALVLPLVAVSVAFGQDTGGNVYNVYPLGFTGPKVEPAFTGLLAAYYLCTANSDFNKSCPARVKPGDTILVHAGTYLDNPAQYSINGLGTPFDGTYYLTAKGTAAKPISIVAAGDGPVIFDGGGIAGVPRNHNLFNVMAADYNLFNGITVQNTDIGFLAGIRDIAGAAGLRIKNSTIQNTGFAICDKVGCRVRF